MHLNWITVQRFRVEPCLFLLTAAVQTSPSWSARAHQVMSHLREMVPAGRVENFVDPPSCLVAQACQPPQGNMDGNQLVQWLSVQAGNTAGDLQHNVRTLMLKANTPLPVADGHDEVARLRQQLRHQKQTHREMQTMLKNQTLAIKNFQNKRQMAGQEAHAFVTRTRSETENLVRAEMLIVWS